MDVTHWNPSPWIPACAGMTRGGLHAGHANAAAASARMRRMPTTILLAEDEQAIADTVLYALRADGYAAEHLLLGGEVLPRLRRGGVDLVILDVGLPDRNGFDVCRELRAESEVPVLFLTARDGEADRMLGLELGGDDYMAKPFSPRELVARVRARLRRQARADDGWRRLGRFDLDAGGHRIRFDGIVL